MYEEDRFPSNGYLSNTSNLGDQKLAALAQGFKDLRTCDDSQYPSIIENIQPSFFDTQSIDSETELGNIHAKSSRVEEHGTGTPNESTLEKDAPETEYPFEEKSVYVDHTNEEVEIGDCSVFFPDGCFNKMEKITIRAEINPSIYPSEFEAITPILTINAPKLRLPATVKLPTWCVSGSGKQEIYIMKCDQSSNRWKKFESKYLEYSRYIEFSTSQFSKFGGFKLRRLKEKLLCWIHPPPPRYRLQPFFYFKGNELALALILDTKLMENTLNQIMEKHYGPNVQRRGPMTIEADKPSTIQMDIKSIETGLNFEPLDNKLSEKVEEITQRSTPMYRELTLQGTESIQKEEIPITYRVTINAELFNGSFFCPNPATDTGRPIPETENVPAESSEAEVHGTDTPNDSIQNARETEYSFEEKTVYDGDIKREVKVGGCSVFFLDGSFDENLQITIRAEVKLERYPSEFEAITPTLTIDAPKSRLPATVKLPTWCVPGSGKHKIYIMRCDRSSDRWKKIESKNLEYSGYIEFRTSKFSKFGAFQRVRELRSSIHSPLRYRLQPVFYYKGNRFALAVIFDNELMDRLLEKIMKKDFGKEVECFKPEAIKVAKHSTIQMDIKSNETGLNFEPRDIKLCETVEEITRRSRPIYETLTLKVTESITKKKITIKYAVEIMETLLNGSFNCQNQAFKLPQQEGGSRSNNINVYQGNATGTNVGAGGQYNQSLTDTTQNISTRRN